ncbi:segregation and condensation protein A [Pseudoalteromonas marina]|uniref:Segregation and condensation protein A n=1 Tax=Pseudoalteromonas marina TaxID=267375 RepID=A0ABT9FIU4_9GAMM|nr:ScpA family protein [Pseudoalteromonas marina]MDP2566406.1 ScpA family protein [Pseudoalteromonas marina]
MEKMTEHNEEKQLPLAFVNGGAVQDKPEDLFIPAGALEVFLESFEGPLDLLLYLIRKQKFDIINLPIFEISKQYTDYINAMNESNLELASDYLVMAAILAEIKSRLLLPVISENEDEEEDPKAQLTRRLLEYERYKIASENIDKLPRLERDTFNTSVKVHDDCKAEKLIPEVELQDLAIALASALSKADNFKKHHIKKEEFSTRGRMTSILDKLKNTDDFIPFETLFTKDEGRAGIVVSFLAILELAKEGFIEIQQSTFVGQIHIKRNINDALDLERII